MCDSIMHRGAVCQGGNQNVYLSDDRLEAHFVVYFFCSQSPDAHDICIYMHVNNIKTVIFPVSYNVKQIDSRNSCLPADEFLMIFFSFFIFFRLFNIHLALTYLISLCSIELNFNGGPFCHNQSTVPKKRGEEKILWLFNGVMIDNYYLLHYH